MPDIPGPISFWLREIRKLQARGKWLAVGPIYAAAAMLMLAVVLMLIVVVSTELFREPPTVQHLRQDQAKQSVSEPRATPAAVPATPKEKGDVLPTTASGAVRTKYVGSEIPHKPVAGPVKNAFGWQFNPVFNDWRYHVGIDIGAAAGSPVQALYSGEVATVYKDKDYGLTVVIVSGADSVYYGSLNSTRLVKGRAVAAGAVVGSVGSCATEPYFHLHVAIKPGGDKYVDPQEVLSKAE